MKAVMNILWVALIVGMISWSISFADDMDSTDFTPPISDFSDFGRQSPQPKAKSRVIIEEQIVVECPPGSSWNPGIQRCLSDTGEDSAPAPHSMPHRATEPSLPQFATSTITWDFESGDLTGWTATGTAFKFQPTYGDNPTARHRGQPSNHQGDFWIGTYENRPTHRHMAGKTQGDGPKGTLTSAPFKIDCNTISFRIGGGCDLNTVRVELLVDGQVVDKATGKCTETMGPDSFPVSRYIGRTARIRLVDDSSGGWGHINFDNVKFE